VVQGLLSSVHAVPAGNGEPTVQVGSPGSEQNVLVPARHGTMQLVLLQICELPQARFFSAAVHGCDGPLAAACDGCTTIVVMAMNAAMRSRKKLPDAVSLTDFMPPNHTVTEVKPAPPNFM
jgi:hypothetical protein